MKLYHKYFTGLLLLSAMICLGFFSITLNAESRRKYVPRPKIDFSINVFPSIEVNFVKDNGDETIGYQVKGLANRTADGIQILYSRDSDKPLEKRLLRLLRNDYSITFQNGARTKDDLRFDLTAQTKVYWDDQDRYLTLLEEIRETLAMLYDSKDFNVSGSSEEERKGFVALVDAFDTYYQLLTGKADEIHSAE